MGFRSRDKAELDTGSLDNTSVFYIVIPEHCTFELFQHNVAMILGVQPGVVVVEVWGHESRIVKKNQKEEVSASSKAKIPIKFEFKASDCVVEFLSNKSPRTEWCVCRVE